MEIILAESNKWLPRLIKWVTKGDKSHCAIRYGEFDDQWLVHASAGGVQPDWWFAFEPRYTNITRFECLFPEATLALDLVVKQLAHKPYDYAGLVGQGLAILFKLKKNPIPNAKAYRCTELLIAFHKQANVLNSRLKLTEFDAEMTTPAGLEAYYKTRPDLFRLKKA